MRVTNCSSGEQDDGYAFDKAGWGRIMWSSFEVERYKGFIAAGEAAAWEAIERIKTLVKV